MNNKEWRHKTLFPEKYYIDCYIGIVKKIRLDDSLVNHFRDVSALEPLEYMGDGNFGKREIYRVNKKHCNEIIRS